MQHSESIAAIGAALAKAQGVMAGASKDKTNPHFKSAYADLASVWDACREALSVNGLAVLQPASADGPAVTVNTILLHSSGEWFSEALTMTAQQNTPQGIGSCITYARRYALASMVGIAPEDDDGNAASQAKTNGATTPAVTTPAGAQDWLTDLESVADEGTEALQKAWKASQPYFRQWLTTTQPDKITALKAKAARTMVPA